MVMEMKKVVAVDGELAALIEQGERDVPHETSLAVKRLKSTITKALARKEGLSAEYEPQRIGQTRGPTLRFDGTLLGEYSTERGGVDRWQEGELWLTRAGAYVAVKYGVSDRERDREFVEALVVAPGDDEMTRQCAVLDHYQWGIMARAMVKGLGWKLERDVE